MQRASEVKITVKKDKTVHAGTHKSKVLNLLLKWPRSANWTVGPKKQYQVPVRYSDTLKMRNERKSISANDEGNLQVNNMWKRPEKRKDWHQSAPTKMDIFYHTKPCIMLVKPVISIPRRFIFYVIVPRIYLFGWLD